MSLNRDCTVQASEAACSCPQPKNDFRLKSLELNLLLTANIFESGPMPTPWKILDSSPVIPSC